MYCTTCGKEIHKDAIICVHCGSSTKNNTGKMASNDDGNIGWLFLGLFFPMIGLILYLIWKDEKPKSSHQAGKGALIGVIISVVMYIISFLLMLMLPTLMTGFLPTMM